ncbi:PREDICTED: general odorant-binding protein 71 [Ceratosolen solmsi marchali]|uniref:General odorant-binding protein 71 n=1 Tax=Ceratosolen solmsi marchali TaxID=326594 RepID=A0AAJ6YIY6_9HYME|nr:PREDICTED: general odorant-binding protein 71 [Ceratosolen solmsi marchali]
MNNNKSSYNYNSRLYFNKRNIRNSQFYPRDFGHNYSNKYNNINNSNMNRNNNNSYYTRDNNHSNYKEQGCIIQCFFNELNIVDQNGFPERSAVIGVMTQNIHDPYLQDFIEESVVECYHYLSNFNREEKCQFSQNLLSCLAEKGSEKCEDWDDEYI